MRGYIAQINASDAATFPAGGTFSNNDENDVRLRSDSIRTSATWANLGFAWRLDGRDHGEHEIEEDEGIGVECFSRDGEQEIAAHPRHDHGAEDDDECP